MIEKAVIQYLIATLGADPVLGPILGNRVYYRRPPTSTAASGQAPVTVKRPWIRVTNSGGMRDRISMARGGSTDATDVLTLYVDDDKQFRGRQIADAVVAALENYRGNMPPLPAVPIAFDTWFRCATVRDLDGFQDAYTYLVTVYVKYRFPTAFPN
jgi:hypothetical protein